MLAHHFLVSGEGRYNNYRRRRKHRPIGKTLFLGPTGSGKTHVIEAAAEALFGDRNAVVKIDCAEFQHLHEISKLIGSPPGYLGHRETSLLLTQENLSKHHTKRVPFTLVLFDEIEKASDALWQLLLGVLDKAALTLGDNRRVDFSQTMVFMTSNLSAQEMSRLINNSICFAPESSEWLLPDEIDRKIYRTAIEAARRNFSPEFMNRIDEVTVFRSLRHEQWRQVIELELDGVAPTTSLDSSNRLRDLPPSVHNAEEDRDGEEVPGGNGASHSADRARNRRPESEWIHDSIPTDNRHYAEGIQKAKFILRSFTSTLEKRPLA